MRVQVHGMKGRKDTVVGTIEWNGSRFILEPESPLLENILERAVENPDTGEKISSEENPEGFLESLRFTYTGAYLRVSAPLEEPQEVKEPQKPPDQGFEHPKVSPSPFRK